MKTNQYSELIEAYQKCLYWNNPNVKMKDLNNFMSLYLKTPLEFKEDFRRSNMFHFPFRKNKNWTHLPKKVQAKRKRVLKTVQRVYKIPSGILKRMQSENECIVFLD